MRVVDLKKKVETLLVIRETLRWRVSDQEVRGPHCIAEMYKYRDAGKD